MRCFGNKGRKARLRRLKDAGVGTGRKSKEEIDIDVVKEDRKLVGVREEDEWRREQPTGEKEDKNFDQLQHLLCF